MGWFRTAIEFLKQLVGFGTKVAENKGQKIVFQQEEIKAEADLEATKITAKKVEIVQTIEGKLDDWLARYDFLKTHVKNPVFGKGRKFYRKQIIRLIDSGAKITGMEIRADGSGERFLVVDYNEPDGTLLKLLIPAR